MNSTSCKVQYSPHKRTRVGVAYNELGVSARQIAVDEGVPAHSVYGIARRYATQTSARDNPRSGRPPKMSVRDKRVLTRMVEKEPYIGATRLIREAGVDISAKTASRWLKQEGIQERAQKAAWAKKGGVKKGEVKQRVSGGKRVGLSERTNGGNVEKPNVNGKALQQEDGTAAHAIDVDA